MNLLGKKMFSYLTIMIIISGKKPTFFLAKLIENNKVVVAIKHIHYWCVINIINQENQIISKKKKKQNGNWILINWIWNQRKNEQQQHRNKWRDFIQIFFWFQPWPLSSNQWINEWQSDYQAISVDDDGKLLINIC